MGVVWQRRGGQARIASFQDEVPIGAVVMRGDEIVAEAHNETVVRRNPTYHAEFLGHRASARGPRD